MLTKRPGGPPTAAVLQAYAKIAPNGPKLTGEGDAEGSVFRLEGSGTVMLAPIPTPVPNGEAEGVVQYSTLARSASWRPEPHAAHFIVTMPGDADEKGSAIDRLRDFTRVLAAIVQVSDAIGVYWGDASATHPAKQFVELARYDFAHMLLWNGVSMAKDEKGRLSLLSLGMGQLGLPNLLLTAPADQATTVLETMTNLLVYIAKRGAPIPEGETVGRTAGEKLPVRYEPSPMDPKERVWRVDIP